MPHNNNHKLLYYCVSTKENAYYLSLFAYRITVLYAISLRSKRFRASSSRKILREQNKGMKGEGREGNARGVFQDREVRGQAFPSFLSPLHSFFCSPLIFSTNSRGNSCYHCLGHLGPMHLGPAWNICPRSHARPPGSGIYTCSWNYGANAVFFLRAAFSLSINCWFRSFQAHLFAVSP